MNTNKKPHTSLFSPRRGKLFHFRQNSVHSLLLAKTTATLNYHPQESTFGEAAVSFPCFLHAAGQHHQAVPGPRLLRAGREDPLLALQWTQLPQEDKEEELSRLSGPSTSSLLFLGQAVLSPHISQTTPLILLTQTQDFPLHGRPWVKIIMLVMTCVVEGSRTVLAGRARFPQWPRKLVQNPHESHLDCETKHGDVRKCGVCRP